jgi:serine protease Do
MRFLLALLFLVAAPAPAQPPDFTHLVREAGASVVNLTARMRPVLPDLPLADDLPDDAEILRDYLRRYFGPSPELQSTGSGFVIDAAGHILTNAHLVIDAHDLVVRLADRREFAGRVLGYDPASDIALVKIEAAGLVPVRIGDPAELRPGEWVATIGSPFGLERSVTAGIVSATGRTLPEETLVPFIQTDVAVNPGNSGGPLLNLRGEVVGVNSQIYSETGGYMGLSFAVPIDVAMDVAAQLRARGRVTRGRIGVRLQEMTSELAAALRAPRAGGALVLEVFKGSAAERAGLRAGDVVVRFAGSPVESDADFVRMTAGARPGATAELELLRFGERVATRVVVEAARTPVLPALAPLESEPLGLELRTIRGRVVVERSSAAAARAGLARGDIILSVNGTAVSSAEGLRTLLQAAGGGATVALLVQRDKARQFLPLRLPR